MPTFYNFRENGVKYLFDDVFIQADLFKQGNLWGWGDNGSGDLATLEVVNKITPVTTFAGGYNWKQVSCGDGPTGAIKTDGTLWVWSSNKYFSYEGQLGDNTIIDRSTPVTTFAGGTDWKQISCGGHQVAAIKTDGSLWIWGSNAYGTLGVNDNQTRSTPVTTFAGGNNWKQVSCGYHFTLAIKTDGTLWSWGFNSVGQVGNNTISYNPNTPVTTFRGGTNWKQVSAGFGHAAAVKTDGTLWVWGGGLNGQLGVGNPPVNGCSIPVTTSAGGNNWKEVSCGGSQTGAIKTDGTLWMWGNNGNPEGVGCARTRLGTNDGDDRFTPVTTFAGGTTWKSIECGRLHTTALKTDGTLWTWGANDYGQLGINIGSIMGYINTTPLYSGSSTPVTTFAGGNNWKQVSGGVLHTMAILANDTL